MKKLAASVMLVVAGAFVLGSGIQAGEEKEVTLKGSITCPKCDLKIEKKCMTVIVTKKGDKETVYYFDKDAHKKYHEEICKESKKGKVTGVVTKQGKKHLIKVKKVEFD